MTELDAPRVDSSTPNQEGRLRLGKNNDRITLILCAGLILVVTSACALGLAVSPSPTSQPTRAASPEPTALASPTPVPGTGTLADPAGRLSLQDQTEIRQLISAYFEARYQSFHRLELQNLDGFKAHTPESEAFFTQEEAKLRRMMSTGKANRLGYVRYAYTLDYTAVSVNVASQRATVTLVEGCDVVYQISQDLRPDDPIVSLLRGRKHTIVLEKMDGLWKIVSDTYPV